MSCQNPLYYTTNLSGQQNIRSFIGSSRDKVSTMDTTQQNQAAQGPNLQNTSNLQTGEQTNGLQQQNSYKQLQQNALGSDAYRNFDGLKVQNSTAAPVTTRPITQFNATSSAWPSMWVWILAVLVFVAFIVYKKTARQVRKAVDTSGKSEVTQVDQLSAISSVDSVETAVAESTKKPTKKDHKSKKSSTKKATSKKKKPAKKSKK